MYKPTLYDRLGPEAASVIGAAVWGVAVFAMCLPVFFLASMKLSHQLSSGAALLWIVGCSAIAGAGTTAAALGLGRSAEKTWRRFAVDGTSTPYKEQYSYQQALVMRGQLEEALESFEAVIAEQPNNVDARIRAAELYARQRQNHARAAELFREIQRIPTVAPGEDVYASNRLVDLLTGPLGDPGRALIELRRIADRYPSLPAATHAREALAALKRRVHGEADSPSA